MATSSFGRAFASARKAGKKTFTWNGKKYTTELAKKTPEKGPVPKARPSTKGKQKDLGKSTGKIPVPKSNPRRDIGASPKTGKVPVPQSNPRNAPAVGIARKGSPIAVAAQRNREKPVAPVKRAGTASTTTPSKVPVPTPKPKQDIGASPKTGKVPVPKPNPRNAKAPTSARKARRDVPTPKPKQDIGASPKTGKVPVPQSNPRNAKAPTSARKARRDARNKNKKPRGILSILFGK